jgi:hypothetical protein
MTNAVYLFRSGLPDIKQAIELVYLVNMDDRVKNKLLWSPVVFPFETLKRSGCRRRR